MTLSKKRLIILWATVLLVVVFLGVRSECKESPSKSVTYNEYEYHTEVYRKWYRSGYRVGQQHKRLGKKYDVYEAMEEADIGTALEGLRLLALSGAVGELAPQEGEDGFSLGYKEGYYGESKRY